MKILHIFCMILCLKLILTLEQYTDYIDDISLEDVRTRPPVEIWQPNFYKPAPKPTRKPKLNIKTTTEMCMKFLLKRKAAEEAENPSKDVKPSGNRWHGPVTYRKTSFRHGGSAGRSTKLRDITQVERKQHKCYKWISSKDIKSYTWPAVLQSNPSDNTILIEICCPQFGPVRIWGNTLCRPYCHSCHNGNCVAPDVCECHDGFVLSDNKDCVFTCPISCLNGHCNLLNRSCLCNAGFKLDETGHFCRPVCKSGCGTNPLHNCTSPQVCGCVRGYSLTDNDCQPIVGG